MSEVETVLGHRFGNRELLTRALTHYSHVYESLPPGAPRTVLRDNEQLEFLGDAILGFIVSEWLIAQFPEYSEGKLSQRKAHLVSAAHLVDVARGLALGRFLFLGKGEEMSGGREKKAMLADALEALIAAVYLDGGIEAARGFIQRCVLTGPGVGAGGDLTERPDYKTVLQELARTRKLPMPRYEVVSEAGPEHSKLFTVQVTVGADFIALGEGSTKKSASQRAAKSVFEAMSAAEVAG